jgi:hypothetical protein
MPITYRTVEEIKERALEALDLSYLDRLHEFQLLQAGFTPEEAKGRLGRADYYDNEIPLYSDVGLASPSDGVSNKLAQDARINTMSLSLWKPELTYDSGSAEFKAVNNAWFNRAWWEMKWEPKLLEIDSDMPLGISIASVGMDEEGMPNWRRYSPLRCLWDPHNRLPEDWEYIFTVDEMSVSKVVDNFGLTLEEAARVAHLRSKIESGGRGEGTHKPKAVRVYRYWEAPTKKRPGSHCVVIGPIFGRDSVWLYLERSSAEEGELKYRRLGESQRQVGPNPYPFLPVQACYEMLIPGVNKPVGRMHWEAALAVFMQRIMKAIATEIDTGGTLRFLSGLGLDEETIGYIKKHGKFDDAKARTLVVEHMTQLRDAFIDLPATQFPTQWLQVFEWLKQELVEASGVSDAQRGQRPSGDMTAYEFAGRMDAQGIQARHAKNQRSQFISGLVSKLRTIAAFYDTRRYELELPEGFVIDTGLMPLRPFLMKPVRIGVAEDSMTMMGQHQRAVLAIERFRSVDLEYIKLGVVDPIKSAENVFKEVYGVVDPTTRGVLSPEQFQMQQQQAALAQMMQSPEVMAALQGGGPALPPNAEQPQQEAAAAA